MEIDETIGIEKYRSIKNSNGTPTGDTRWMSKNFSDESHTFFPIEWDEHDAIEEFATALMNPQRSNYLHKTNAFTAKSKSGVLFGWWLDSNNNITSFFPIF